MKVILFGATGMLGQAVLRECLLDPEVTRVLAIGRAPTGIEHEKLRDVVRAELSDLSDLGSEFADYDACFFCLGVSSVGMSETSYRAVTYDLTLAIARTLVANAKGMTFVYVSGAGTDSSERGRSMWARVKGQTENALLSLPFKAAYMFRPGYIQPRHAVRSRTTLYRMAYGVVGPLYPLLKLLFPRQVTTSDRIGQAMLAVVRHGAPQRVLQNNEIEQLLVPRE
jgi:uncharacterized protein YbjT (DUF2867 family)